MARQLRIGCAGWTIPKQHAALFAPAGSHLERYAARLHAVEINSSFYRAHRRATYERWAAQVPDGFAFSVKAPKVISHELRLHEADEALDQFVAQVSGLGDALGALLFQLPPSFGFNAKAASAFFDGLRARFGGSVVCEPRHPDWFSQRADDLLREYRIARVAADPPVVEAARVAGGWGGLIYFRLHGSPRIYYSQYGRDRLEQFATELTSAPNDCALWCIFDNTAAGWATADALALQEHIGQL